MVEFSILPGLPPYGPPALSFPRPDAFREGLVVEFLTDAGKRWVGNFATSASGRTIVRTELGERAVVVVASGAGYVVDVAVRQLVRALAANVQEIWFETSSGAMIMSNGLWFEAFDTKSVRWRSRRISWDGMRGVRRRDQKIVGDAYSPLDDGWRSFEVDIESGAVVGGSYNGPPM